MRAYWAAITCAVFLFISSLMPVVAFAQNAADHVTVSAAPDWVTKLPRPTGIFEAAKELKVGYRIVDYQNKVDPLDRVRYRRFYMDLNNSQAIEDEGTLGLTFDPSYQYHP